MDSLVETERLRECARDLTDKPELRVLLSTHEPGLCVIIGFLGLEAASLDERIRNLEDHTTLIERLHLYTVWQRSRTA